jgi:hypothetical protein
MKKLNYLEMLKEIDILVNNDFCEDMECRLLPGGKFTIKEEEVKEMVKIISKVYSVSHCIHCKTCQRKYLTFEK